MASSRSFFISLSAVFALLCFRAGAATSVNKRANQDRCAFKVQSGPDGSRRLSITFRTENCSLNYPMGKHVIHQVTNISFTHLACEDQAAVVIHWSPSPLGIEHVKGFRVYLEDKNPEGKRCQHLILKDPRQLNFSHRNTKLSSQPFSGLNFDTDYMVRVVPFPSLMNESFFPPSFLRTNSCEVLLGPDSLVCKPFWKPKTMNVSQLGSNLHVVFEQAPSSFGFTLYYLYYKLRQDGPFKLQRCKPDVNQLRTTCILQDITPGTYTIELRDDVNVTRRQTQYHVSQVQSPWAGPIRAMAITVPLVVISAFATLFTVMCRKKQQENIYSQLDEESSESSNQSAALSPERPWPRPKVFLCYSNRDCPKHSSVIQSFAYFLQDFCCCEVVLDLWEHLEICREGQMSWLSRQLDEADFIITVCSRGLRYYVEKSRKGKAPVGRQSGSLLPAASLGDLFIVSVSMIAEKLRLAKQSEGYGAPELNRYLTVYFDYSSESDIPTMLTLASRFKLMDQLPQLFSRLHSSQSSLAESESLPVNVSRRNYFKSKSGRSLYVSICNMHQHISQNPDWFEKQLAPSGSSSGFLKGAPAAADEAPSPPPKPHGSSVSCQPEHRLDSGLMLNEVMVRSQPLEDRKGALRKTMLLLPPGSSHSLELGPSPSPALCPSPGPSPSPSPGLCPSPGPLPSSLPMQRDTSRSTSRTSAPLQEEPSSSSSSASSVLHDRDCCAPAPTEEGHSPPPERPPPRDSGIYDSSVPSSELSIPLMEGLSHDHADSSSLAESESSSSGLGDEEPPTVGTLGCSATTVCKAELHHHQQMEHSNGRTTVASL